VTESHDPWFPQQHATAFGVTECHLRVVVLRPERHDHGVSCAVPARRGEKHRVAAGSGKARKNRFVHRLEPTSRREWIRERGRAASLGGCETLGGLDERQWVAVGRLDESGHNRRCGARREQSGGVADVEAVDRQVVEPVEGGAGR
jgi:hypothetical protein